jgi:hypothetical protein
MNEGNYLGDCDVGDVSDTVVDTWLQRMYRSRETEARDRTDKTDKTDDRKQKTKEIPKDIEREFCVEKTDTWTLYGYRPVGPKPQEDRESGTTDQTVKTVKTEEEKLDDNDPWLTGENDTEDDTTVLTETGEKGDKKEEEEKLRLSKREELDASIKTSEVIFILWRTTCSVRFETEYYIYIYKHAHTHTHTHTHTLLST